MRELSNNQLVDFNDGVNHGSGFVKGFASVELPVVGRLVIIEYTSLLSIYNNEQVPMTYDCIVVHECHIY